MTEGSIDESCDRGNESDLIPDEGKSTLELLYNLKKQNKIEYI